MANKLKKIGESAKIYKDFSSEKTGTYSDIPKFDTSDIVYKVEVNKIKQILRETLYKFKFAVCLPYLLDENCKLLSQLLDSKQDFENIRHLIVKYKPKEDIDEPKGENTVEFDYANVQEFQDFFNNYVSEFRGIDNSYDELNLAIDFLYKQDKIKDVCDKAIFGELPNNIQDLVKALDLFFNILLDRMSTTPRQERMSESNISKIINESSGITDEINKLQSIVLKLTDEKTKIVFGNQKQIDKIESDTIELREVLRKSLEKNTMLFERKMEWEWKIHDVNEKKQLEILKEKKAVLESLINTNADQESQARTLKFRQNTQLEALINKYDKDMTEKKHYLGELSNKWKKLRLDLAYAEKVFSDQHIDYLKHKSDKHAYEKQLWDKKLYRIRCSIAARKIQRYFRLYLKIAAKFESQTPKKSKSRQKSILAVTNSRLVGRRLFNVIPVLYFSGWQDNKMLFY
ncbi:uncharacterized protein isoform X2 [Rhodnius prolixus]|uniref:uncharacterized protein isoform X2 n=1 Tax=Rhodnius prolixus TaxID=13249 RepID=UPI003D18EC33